MRLSSDSRITLELVTLVVAVIAQALMLAFSPILLMAAAYACGLFGWAILASVTIAPISLMFALFRERKILPLLIFYAAFAMWAVALATHG